MQSNKDQGNFGMRMAITDRGQVDRRVFRRALFSQGKINPKVMVDEAQFVYGLENNPMQCGAIVMLMINSEKTMERKINPGPVTNMDFLPPLYEQYWRLHQEILDGEVPYRVYQCIDAEAPEEVYERFKYTLDTALNIHSIYAMALSQAFPKEFDEALSVVREMPDRSTPVEKILSKRLGMRVRVVGGDDMESEWDLLEKPFLEGVKLRKPPK